MKRVLAGAVTPRHSVPFVRVFSSSPWHRAPLSQLAASRPQHKSASSQPEGSRSPGLAAVSLKDFLSPWCTPQPRLVPVPISTQNVGVFGSKQMPKISARYYSKGVFGYTPLKAPKDMGYAAIDEGLKYVNPGEEYAHLLNPDNISQCEEEYHQRMQSLGELFIVPKNALWALYLAKHYLQAGAGFYHRSFDYARDSLVMLLGHESPEYRLLRETNWFAGADNPYLEASTVLCHTIPAPYTAATRLISNSAKLVAGKSLFFMGHYMEAANFLCAALLDMVQPTGEDATLDYGTEQRSFTAPTDFSQLQSSLDTMSAHQLSYPYFEIFRTRRLLALCYRRCQHWDQAVLILEDGLREANSHQHGIQAQYLQDIGATCIEAKRFNAAYEAYNRALIIRSGGQLALPPLEKQQEVSIQHGMAIALEGLNNYQGALVAFQQALAAAEDVLQAAQSAAVGVSGSIAATPIAAMAGSQPPAATSPASPTASLRPPGANGHNGSHFHHPHPSLSPKKLAQLYLSYLRLLRSMPNPREYEKEREDIQRKAELALATYRATKQATSRHATTLNPAYSPPSSTQSASPNAPTPTGAGTGSMEGFMIAGVPGSNGDDIDFEHVDAQLV